MNLLATWGRRRDSKHLRRLHDLESQLEAKDRIIKILQAEVESLSAVAARDRMRILAETAEFARRKAEAERNGNRT
jgi:hypothetical protein